MGFKAECACYPPLGKETTAYTMHNFQQKYMVKYSINEYNSSNYHKRTCINMKYNKIKEHKMSRLQPDLITMTTSN